MLAWTGPPIRPSVSGSTHWIWDVTARTNSHALTLWVTGIWLCDHKCINQQKWCCLRKNRAERHSQLVEVTSLSERSRFLKHEDYQYDETFDSGSLMSRSAWQALSKTITRFLEWQWLPLIKKLGSLLTGKLLLFGGSLLTCSAASERI